MNIKKMLAALIAWACAKSSHGAAVAAVTAGAVGTALDLSDPWPWVIGAFGGAVLFLKRDEVSRKDSVGTVMISVVMGGLVAPFAALGWATYVESTFANRYLFALALSAAWPFILPKLLDQIPLLPNIFGGKK